MNSHQAQIPGRRTGSKKHDSLVPPPPLENINKFQTVNSIYSGHCRDLELVSTLARVSNGGSLFQLNISNTFLLGI